MGLDAPRADTIASHFGWFPLFAVAIFFAAAASDGAEEREHKSVALLAVDYSSGSAPSAPASAAEQARIAAIQAQFQDRLAESGRFTFVTVPPAVRARIDQDQAIGACGGCEITYGRELGGDVVAWINVQKVSSLILSVNVTVADVDTQRIKFVRSVDIRSDDKSWSRSLDYLIKHHLLETPI
ncbi:hypothetical protein W911_03755 [Hyphomicrobium nitrativorans NL23]|uniref:DUF2380 domain-containing protein n=1 Tax=Hyphomicrobium nitrativorans NL23 TaxID=1029756 RepID=V5SCG3_9HYPH|nr:DUF3280 domain-containing protein [Hyphomicrobium nitrativorans]AHB47715.1 hypothetical protein W911_03755 [Hyphomicrobium nitrativorans NL23]